MMLSATSVPACIAPTGEGGLEGCWPKAPGGTLAGFVVTIRKGRVCLRPVYKSNGGYRIDALQRHLWVLRRAQQVATEAKAGPVFVVCFSDRGYEKFQGRQCYRRRQGQRRVWFGVPQTGLPRLGSGQAGEWRFEDRGRRVEAADCTCGPEERGVVVFHTDPVEGGEPVPDTREALYGLIDSLVDAIPPRRHVKSSDNWGKEYRGSRGDGREQNKTRLVFRALSLVLENERASPDLVAPFSGMAGLTVREIKDRLPGASRSLLLGMLRDELRGEPRKTVLSMLMNGVGNDVLQLCSRDSIGKAARALDMQLDPDTHCGTRRLPADEAFKRLQRAGLNLYTPDLTPGSLAFSEWRAANCPPLRDSAQIGSGPVTLLCAESRSPAAARAQAGTSPRSGSFINSAAPP